MDQVRENSPPKSLLLQHFLAAVNERFRELHEVTDYASLLRITSGHLSEMAKLQTGKPALKHIHERIIAEAKYQIQHTDNFLKNIATDLGFADASYFNRFFKRETGVTPASYRANMRKLP